MKILNAAKEWNKSCKTVPPHPTTHTPVEKVTPPKV